MSGSNRNVSGGCFRLAAILLLGLLFGGTFYYLYQGGYLDTATARFASWRTRAERNPAQGSAPEHIPLPDAPIAAITSKLAELAGGDIQVFFAPCTPVNPVGIDDRLVALLQSATRSILCAFYELQLESVADVLIAQHQKGVTVRVVSDSDYKDREAIQRCIQAGVPVVFDNRDAFMHDKFCVIDGTRVWTGSTNITEACMYRNNNNAVLINSRELAVNFTNELQEMFEKRRFGGRSPKNTTYPEISVGETRIECYFAPEDAPQKEIIQEIEAAQANIDFMAFVFTSKNIAEAMAKRMTKGVRVRGVLEARGLDPKHSRDKYLAERGAEMHMDKNEYTMHHKVIIIDVRTVVTGSYNFSASAEDKNDENVLIIHSPDVAKQYTVEFEKLIAP